MGTLTRVTENFETASLPTTSPEERKRLLSFVVCGGGPTGVETAAVCAHFLICATHVKTLLFQEIYDLCQEDIINYVNSYWSVPRPSSRVALRCVVSKDMS